MNAVTPAHLLVLLGIAAVWYYRARIARFLQGASPPSPAPPPPGRSADDGRVSLADLSPQQAFDIAVAKANQEAERIKHNAIAQEMGAILIQRLTPISSALPAEAAPHPAAALADKPAGGAAPK